MGHPYLSRKLEMDEASICAVRVTVPRMQSSSRAGFSFQNQTFKPFLQLYNNPFKTLNQ